MMTEDNSNFIVLIVIVKPHNISPASGAPVAGGNGVSGKNAPWLSVPQFGDWDQKGPLPDYSLDFSKIREMRKQNKREISRTSIGNEEDFISSNKPKLDTTPQPKQEKLIKLLQLLC
ncbi:hypothetical protein Ccrd_013089 [Cynara cardunculus var. scolymus]|uniref:RIN4 pathogenic type III effector avirulence factor Avr cleavage site domain-containing protein n=1 Tax=Cynara cardunculus var. scolymus TaxID=59895 RepID=A0A103YG78_CYNCS|nr:hypothetical protein Ccrd_013089 [Cynara cardunculus var. scolymus]